MTWQLNNNKAWATAAPLWDQPPGVASVWRWFDWSGHYRKVLCHLLGKLPWLQPQKPGGHPTSPPTGEWISTQWKRSTPPPKLPVKMALETESFSFFCVVSLAGKPGPKRNRGINQLHLPLWMWTSRCSEAKKSVCWLHGASPWDYTKCTEPYIL